MKGGPNPRALLRGGSVLVALVAFASPAAAQGPTAFGLSPTIQALALMLVLVTVCVVLYSLLEQYTEQTSGLIVEMPRTTLLTGVVVTAAVLVPYGLLVGLVATFGSPGVLPLVVLTVLGIPILGIMLTATGIGLIGIGRTVSDQQGVVFLVAALIAAPVGAFPVPLFPVGLVATVLGVGAMFWDMRRGRSELDSQERESYGRQHRFM